MEFDGRVAMHVDHDFHAFVSERSSISAEFCCALSIRTAVHKGSRQLSTMKDVHLAEILPLEWQRN
jgi:hypothetical protein